MNNYRTPRCFTLKDATRKVLRGYAARNKAEQHIDSFENEAARVANTTRERLVAESPSATDAEIDARLNRIMTAGAHQTADKIPEPRGIPKDVQSARRAERRKQVRNGRQFRK